MTKKGNKTAILTVLLMIFATLCAKATGMLRQMMLASIFAAGMEGVAFSAASKIPLAIFDMLFSTAILGSFLPIYRGHLSADAPRAKRFSSAFFTFTGLLTAMISLLGILLARPIIALAAPNLDEATATLAVALLRIMFPAMIFAGMAYTLIGILQSHEKFLLPASVSAISNTIIIVYLLFCGKIEDKTTAVWGLAIAYLLSWAAQFFALMIPLLHTHQMPRISAKFQNEDLILAGKRTPPVMLGAWLIPMTTLIANAFSSYIDGNTIEAGALKGAAIVVFENAFSVFSIAGGLMTYGICNYLFPKLSAKFAGGDEEGFGASARMGLFISLAVTLPIAIFVFLLSDEIIHVLYFRGSFTKGLADAAATSLRTLSLALPAYSIIEFLSRIAYSCGKVKYPMAGAICGILAGFLSAGIFALLHALSVFTVALSAVIGLTAAAGIQLLLARRTVFRERRQGELSKHAIWLFGVAISAFVMTATHIFLKKIMEKSGTFQNLVIIAIVFLLGSMVYLIWIFLFRNLFFSKFTSGKEDTL